MFLNRTELSGGNIKTFFKCLIREQDASLQNPSSFVLWGSATNKPIFFLERTHTESPCEQSFSFFVHRHRHPQPSARTSIAPFYTYVSAEERKLL